MKQPLHISEVMHQLVLNNPHDPYAQILRHYPFIQIQMLRKGYMSLNELTPEEIERLTPFEDIEEIKRKEAAND